MDKYKIYAGLGGGFGGANFVNIEECEDSDHAKEYAYQAAIESYESYEGSQGIRSTQDIMDEDGVGEDEAYGIYMEELEGWIDYYVEKCKEDVEYDDWGDEIE